MKILFYLIGVIAILYEFIALIDTKKVNKGLQKLKLHFKKVKSGEANTKDLKGNLANFLLLQMGYIIWVITGLFSSNGILFLIIFLISAIPKGNIIIVRKLDALITLSLLILILLNKFQLHINIYDYILNLIM